MAALESFRNDVKLRRIDGEMTNWCPFGRDHRWKLANDWQASQNQAQGQVDTLLGILHIDAGAADIVPERLQRRHENGSTRCWRRAYAGRRRISQEASTRCYRPVTLGQGEAAALGMSSIESRAHAFEDDLKALREKPALSGNDFLPLVIKLDDLLTHLQSVSELVSRLSRLHNPQHDVVHTITAVLQGEKPKLQGAHGDSGVEATLQQLTARVARENNKEATLQCTGPR